MSDPDHITIRRNLATKYLEDFTLHSPWYLQVEILQASAAPSKRATLYGKSETAGKTRHEDQKKCRGQATSQVDPQFGRTGKLV
jgi:hypothetical protein